MDTLEYRRRYSYRDAPPFPHDEGFANPQHAGFIKKKPPHGVPADRPHIRDFLHRVVLFGIKLCHRSSLLSCLSQPCHGPPNSADTHPQGFRTLNLTLPLCQKLPQRFHGVSVYPCWPSPLLAPFGNLPFAETLSTGLAPLVSHLGSCPRLRHDRILRLEKHSCQDKSLRYLTSDNRYYVNLHLIANALIIALVVASRLRCGNATPLPRQVKLKNSRLATL